MLIDGNIPFPVQLEAYYGRRENADSDLRDIRLDSQESQIHGDQVQTLSCLEMWFDGIKAMKTFCDPVSECFGTSLGVICCIAVMFANDEENRERTATRHDVLYANQIRRQQASEANCAFRLGFFAGDVAIDCLSSSAGVIVGAPRATYLSCTGNNDRRNTIFGYSREDIDTVELLDSCGESACCFNPS